jgi:hypothetical protein
MDVMAGSATKRDVVVYALLPPGSRGDSADYVEVIGC